MRTFFSTLISLLLLGSVPSSAGKDLPRTGFSAIQQTRSAPSYRTFLVNNIFAYFGNNGDGLYNPFRPGHAGFEFLKGQDKHAFYEEGLVWGGLHKGRTTPKVGGSTYRHALQPGPLVVCGTATTYPVAATDTTGDNYRIYRVRPDINPRVAFETVESILQSEEVAFISRYESTSAKSIYDQYVKDWNEWPSPLGAPFTYGKNASGIQRTTGVYDPQFDTPGIPAAMQTLWYVANDMDSTLVALLAGCPPIGLEMQRTIWGYTRNMGPLTTTIFQKTVLINKSGAPVDSMYFAQWSDPDLGNADDDFVGCDTAKSLGYVYNGTPSDAVFGTAVPAAGHVMLQGPIVPAPGKIAAFGLKSRQDFKNLPMTAFFCFAPGVSVPMDPATGERGAIEWYRVMKGLSPCCGIPIIDPTNGRQTRFMMYGNPLNNIESGGWTDGMGGLQPGDRRMAMGTGPFTLADGDTQEIVVATIAAQGPDRLSSILSLRDYADKLNVFWKDLTGIGTTTGLSQPSEMAPASFALFQNYPNPFNGSTTIGFGVGGIRTGSGVPGLESGKFDNGQSALGIGHLRLRVYDLLGREVAVLVNEKKEPGYYSATWDATGMASGVYLFRIQSGDFIHSRKMIFLK
jgi:hypothetical protein